MRRTNHGMRFQESGTTQRVGTLIESVRSRNTRTIDAKPRTTAHRRIQACRTVPTSPLAAAPYHCVQYQRRNNSPAALKSLHPSRDKCNLTTVLSTHLVTSHLDLSGHLKDTQPGRKQSKLTISLEGSRFARRSHRSHASHHLPSATESPRAFSKDQKPV